MRAEFDLQYDSGLSAEVRLARLVSTMPPAILQYDSRLSAEVSGPIQGDPDYMFLQCDSGFSAEVRRDDR
jgi:hypothetical protein